MNLSQFISSKLSTAGGNAAFIVKIAGIAVAISTMVMILAVSISAGYDSTIKEKVFGFLGHINVEAITVGYNEDDGMKKDSIFKKNIDSNDISFSIKQEIKLGPFNFQRQKRSKIKAINYYADKPGLIKTDELMQGILYKGIEQDFDWSYFQEYLVEGEFPTETNDVLISTALKDLIGYEIGDKVIVYFIQEPMRTRALTVCGFYNTNLVEFDEQVIFSSLKHIQTLNGWDDDEVGGVELFVDNPNQSSEIAQIVQKEYVNYDKWVNSIEDKNPEIFDWLGFIKNNQWIVLILMGVVAIVNMISMLLVIILERTKMIGTLKALGGNYRLIQAIFLRKALQIMLRGLLIGNILGIGFALIQKYGKIIQLNPEHYFLSHIPIEIDIILILLLNGITILVIFLSLLVPTLMIRRINPIQTLRFD